MGKLNEEGIRKGVGEGEEGKEEKERSGEKVKLERFRGRRKGLRCIRKGRGEVGVNEEEFKRRRKR
jgi:hypothetical protein